MHKIKNRLWISVALCAALGACSRGTLPGGPGQEPSPQTDGAMDQPDLGRGDMGQCGGSAMIEVPGGSFLMGTPPDLGGAAEERPAHRQTVQGFLLDRSEVTVAAYRSCVAAGGCSRPGTGPSCNWTDAPQETERHPINCVDWSQAARYCAWRCARLPTEIEWELAARGEVGSTWVWGADPPDSAGKAETRSCWRRGTAGTCPVGSYAATLRGAPAPDGLWDLAGNVWEWVDTFQPCPYPLDPRDPGCRSMPDQGARGCRGGGWQDANPSALRGASRGFMPNSAYTWIGFRCASGTGLVGAVDPRQDEER